MKTGVRFLNKQAIEAGKNPITSTDITDFAVYAPDYRNIKVLDLNDRPDLPIQVTIPALQGSTRVFIRHNLGYVPQMDLFFQDLNGFLRPIPGASNDVAETCAIILEQGWPDYDGDGYSDGSDLNQIGIAIGSKATKGYIYPFDTTLYIGYNIYVDESRGNLFNL